jgi:hypothetical protein
MARKYFLRRICAALSKKHTIFLSEKAFENDLFFCRIQSNY